MLYQLNIKFMKIRNVVKDFQGFGHFSHKYFKLRKKTKLILLFIVKVKQETTKEQCLLLQFEKKIVM